MPLSPSLPPTSIDTANRTTIVASRSTMFSKLATYRSSSCPGHYVRLYCYEFIQDLVLVKVESFGRLHSLSCKVSRVYGRQFGWPRFLHDWASATVTRLHEPVPSVKVPTVDLLPDETVKLELVAFECNSYRTLVIILCITSHRNPACHKHSRNILFTAARARSTLLSTSFNHRASILYLDTLSSKQNKNVTIWAPQL